MIASSAHKSMTFSIYNKAMRAAKQGASFCGMKLTPQRVNKALSVLQQKEDRPYHTTRTSCDCPDHQKRPMFACGHMIGKMIEFRVEEELLKKAQSVIINLDSKIVFVDGQATEIEFTAAMDYCNKHAAGRNSNAFAISYRM